jgi:2'-5' RNA ligase
MEVKNPLILTVRLDEKSQQFFNEMRLKHFPRERNLLDAHLTLFHQLPDNEETLAIIQHCKRNFFTMEVIKLINLGAGVAYKVESPELELLRQELKKAFNEQLIPQDKQGFRAHITIQNKTTPEEAKSLIARLSESFETFNISAQGLDLWEYLRGPWQHRSHQPFDYLDK